ncbi:MAG: GNAT family N-acetyltransferase [Sedimentisphaerales bacterium]|nr:GNAT family N-acetyltransferase [Sedimentisphaerales bacterium]
MVCRMYGSFEDASPWRQAWDRLVEETGSGIYMTYDWCRVWWDFYGAGRNLAILVFEKPSGLAGVVPMFSERLWLGPIRITIAKLVGSDFTMSILNPPVINTEAEKICSHVLHFFLTEQGCDAVWLGPISEVSAAYGIIQSCKETKDFRIVRNKVRSPYTLFELPDSAEAYLSGLPADQRQCIRRGDRNLKKSFSVRSEIITDPKRVIDAFQSFMKMHQLQWNARNRLGHFEDWPKGQQFNLAQVKAHAEQGRVCIIDLWVDDQIVCREWCFILKNMVHWRLFALSTDEKYRRYGLGRLGFMQILEWALPQGVRQIEAGAGHYDYKMALGGREYPLRSVLIAGNRFIAWLRVMLFDRLCDLFHLLYYRIWYCRIRPRLPLRGRPLWQAWTKRHL